MDCYVHKTKKLLKSFDKTENLIRDYVVLQYGEKFAVSLSQTARQKYEQLIPNIPYNDSMPALNSFLRISAMELSVFMAMKEHGKSAPEAWLICHEALKARTEVIPKLLRRLIG